MGIFYGAAKKNSIMGQRKAAGKYLHGTYRTHAHPRIYDTLAFMQTETASLLLLAFVVFMYIIAIKYVKKFSREDWKASFYTDTLSDLPLDGKNQR